MTMRSRPTTEKFFYTWDGMPQGVSKVAESAVDALFEVLCNELKIKSPSQVFVDLEIPHASVSRVRHRTGGYGDIPDLWLHRAAWYSGIPYDRLCALVKQEPFYCQHANARKVISVKEMK